MGREAQVQLSILRKYADSTFEPKGLKRAFPKDVDPPLLKLQEIHNR